MTKTIDNIARRNVFLHALSWAIYIGYELFFILVVYQVKSSLISYFFFYLCNIGLFYWHFYTLSRYLKRTDLRFFLMILMVVVEIFTVLLVKLIYDYLTLKDNFPQQDLWKNLKVVAGMDFQRTLLYIYFSTVLWSVINFSKFRRDTAEALLKNALIDKAHTDLQYQFAQAQNAFLKQQINPHLLFNTLNAIYTTVYIHSPDDSRLVLLLSDIMRYSYEDPGPQGRVALENEIRQLRNLIELNTFRFQDTVQLDLNITGDAGELSIIPLVLITLTENMFKHGDLRVPPHSLEIAINPNGQLRYISRNVPKPRGDYDKDTHVGLSNTRLRLDYAYPNNYALQINETDALFLLELTINLAYERNHH